jgi:hypothetical protein
VWVTPQENPRLPFACYLTTATRQSRDPDPVLYLNNKWYCLHSDSKGKPSIGARQSEIETAIAQETIARETVETPLPIEVDRPTSPDSIDEPEKRQTAPIPMEIKMGTGTRVEVSTET